jgi:hypothetical protein
VDDASIEINSNALRVKALGITNAMLAGSISDSKMASDYVQTSEVDDVTIEWNGSNLLVKALGISNGQLANDTIQEPKLNATNTPTDGQVLSYNQAGTNFTWIDNIAPDAIEESDVALENESANCNGITTVFTLSNATVVNSVQVFLNGLIKEEGAAKAYVLSGTSVTFSVAPETGDILLIHYLND